MRTAASHSGLFMLIGQCHKWVELFPYDDGESVIACSERLFIIYWDYKKNECVDFYFYRLVVFTQLFKHLIKVIFA